MSQAKAGDPAPAPGPSAKPRAPQPPVRPLSPHLQVWRWHVTMLASILTRATGIALYAGAVVVTAWLACAAAGPAAYGGFAQFGSSIIGLIMWIGLTLSAAYHFAAGIRHLIWDTGAGLTRKAANALANLSIWFAVVVTVGFWIWLLLSQHVIWNGGIV